MCLPREPHSSFLLGDRPRAGMPSTHTRIALGFIAVAFLLLSTAAAGGALVLCCVPVCGLHSTLIALVCVAVGLKSMVRFHGVLRCSLLRKLLCHVVYSTICRLLFLHSALDADETQPFYHMNPPGSYITTFEMRGFWFAWQRQRVQHSRLKQRSCYSAED